jgi:type IV pilus assembly protein PilY1
MATTGIGSAFQPLKADVIRLGWSTIKNLNSDSVLDRGVSSFDAGTSAGGTKNLFFTWLYGRTFDGGTPNLPAVNKIGQYYERTDSDGPWSSIPDPASTGITTVTTAVGPGKTELPANHLSCRRSYSMLITDGYSNSGIPTTAGNSDNTGFSILPAVGTAFTYTPAAPYNDAASNTMADIAMHYWGRDLRSLANRVPRISSTRGDNPSTWQNVSFYAVTLGIDGTLPQTTATIANIKAGTPWPTPVESKPTTIDDIWHATINGRGELLNASNGSELTTGLNRMFETIAGSPQTLSGVAVSTTFLKNGTRKYKPQYTPGTWSGNLSAIKLDPTTGNDLYPPITFWQVERGVDVNGDPISLIPAAASRNIVTWTGTLAATFNTTNTGLSADIVNYVRGDPAKEQRKSGGTYRNRTAKLGDIVNSGPAYILDNVDLNYEKLGFTNYRRFVATKAARTEGVLFVGANDGMLHAFRNSTGAEIFAFVPKAVWPKLNKLTEPSTTVGYAHQYYVDGPNTETDAYLDGNWANVLLGTTGAGAKAVYALNVTNPTSMNASKVLWEVNSSSTGFTNLGHVLSDVQAGKVEAVGALANDDWVAVFGNGFDSSTGVASLFVVNLKTGALLKEIVADSSGANGLGGVRLVRDATQQVIGAYAGDLKGNLWKFDLKGTDKANWKVGLSGPLYAAGSTRAITATPAIVAHPNGGYVVAFGTGKFTETTDTSEPFETQRMYGIWDKQPFGATSVVAGDAVTGDTALQQQTITTVTISSIKYYAVSTNPVAWGDGLSTGKRGWYINLPNSGQRVANPLERLFEKSGGTFVIASTISPVSSAAPDLCVQSGSGSGWVYLIDGLTGSGSTLPTLDTNGDGVIDSLDAIVSGFQDAVDGLPKAITTGSDTGCIVTAQDTCVKFKLQCGQVGQPGCPPTATPGSLTIKKREWRQLFMR